MRIYQEHFPLVTLVALLNQATQMTRLVMLPPILSQAEHNVCGSREVPNPLRNIRLSRQVVFYINCTNSIGVNYWIIVCIIPKVCSTPSLVVNPGLLIYFIITRKTKGKASAMMLLFIISYTPLKEVNNNAADQTYTERCMTGTCFPLTLYRDNLTKKRASSIMALSSDGAAYIIAVLNQSTILQ